VAAPLARLGGCRRLALIQRNADKPAPSSSRWRGARERELRSWLYGRPAMFAGGGESLAAAITTVADEVEGSLTASRSTSSPWATAQ